MTTAFSESKANMPSLDIDTITLGECRAESDNGELRLSGLVIPWGKQATDRPERFERNSLSWRRVALRSMHQNLTMPIASFPSGGLTLENRDDGLYMRAVLADTQQARDTVAAVEGGIANGLSIEFRAKRDRVSAGLRIVDEALLFGIAVVPQGAYDTHIEAREQHQDTRRELLMRWL